MGRKRRTKRRDLRDFWPWYERHWDTEWPAQPPPFELHELNESNDAPLPPRIVLFVAIGVLIFIVAIWYLVRSQ